MSKKTGAHNPCGHQSQSHPEGSGPSPERPCPLGLPPWLPLYFPVKFRDKFLLSPLKSIFTQKPPAFPAPSLAMNQCTNALRRRKTAVRYHSHDFMSPLSGPVTRWTESAMKLNLAAHPSAWVWWMPVPDFSTESGPHSSSNCKTETDPDLPPSCLSLHERTSDRSFAFSIKVPVEW